MDSLVVPARIALGFVFALSGVAKAFDRTGAVRAAAAMGVPARFAGIVGRGLPVAEIAVAALLVAGVTAWWGALAAALLLVAFTAALAANLLRGKRPPCNCFGQLSDKAISWGTVARNAGLLAAAGFVLVARAPDEQIGVLHWVEAKTEVGQLPEVVSLLGAVVFAQGLVIAWLVGQVRGAPAGTARAAEGEPAGAGAPAGLPIGSAAPPFELESVAGGRVALADLTTAGKPALIVFMDPSCASCNGMVPEVGEWQRDHDAAMTIAVVSTGGRERNLEKVEAHGLTNVLLDDTGEIGHSFAYEGTPGAVLVDSGGRIASPIASGTPAIRALVARTVGNIEPPAVASDVPLGDLDLGDPVPHFHLEGLDGRHIAEGILRGQLNLLFFWDPMCSFCMQMQDEVRSLEARLRDAGVQAVFISLGDPDRVRALGLKSLVLLDPTSAVHRRFGAFGTPIALLVDAEGKIASELGVAREGVLALADRALTLGAVALSLTEG